MATALNLNPPPLPYVSTTHPDWVNDCPQGYHNDTDHTHYPYPAFYIHYFSRLGDLLPITGENLRGRYRRRDHPYQFTQINWMSDFGDRANADQKHQDLNTMQALYLPEFNKDDDPNFVDAPAFVGFRSEEVYDFIAMCICRFEDNGFCLDDMKELFFLLQHMDRGDACTYIQSLEIANISDGPYIKAALALLHHTGPGLRTLRLGLCGTCRERLCPPDIWRAWMSVSGLVNLGVTGLQLYDRPADDPCGRCKRGVVVSKDGGPASRTRGQLGGMGGRVESTVGKLGPLRKSLRRAVQSGEVS